jgi:YVTN family beta-propeller protein
LKDRIHITWRGERRGTRRAALLFVMTLGAYWIVWVTRVYAGLRSRSPASTRVTPRMAALLLLLPFVNVAFEACLALDLPRAVRRARAPGTSRPSVETEPLTVLLLAAPFAAIALAIAIGLSPLVVGYLAWPFELPAMLTVQRVLNSQGGEVVAGRRAQGVPPRAFDGETVASLVLAVAVVGALVVSLAGGGEEDRSSNARPVPQEQFSDVAASPGALWVTRIDKGTLQRLDPRDGQPVGLPIKVGRSPYDVASGFGAIWVANYRSDTVSRIDPATGHAEAAPIEVGRGPFGIAVGLGSVWVTDQVDRRIIRIDPRTNRVLRRIPIGYGPRGVDVGEGAVWAAASDSRAVFRFDPRSHRTTKIPVGRFCQDVAVGGGSVWVAAPEENQVLRIDPTGNRIVGKPIGVGLSPTSIDYGSGLVWVANAGDGSVSRIDPRTAKLVGKPIEVGKKVNDLTARGKVVWVLRGDGKVRLIRP